MTLTKDCIICPIHKKIDISKTKSAQLIESILEIIKKRLENGEDIIISRFGKFCVKNKSERKGINPRSGNDLMLGSRRVVTFKCSPIFLDKVARKQLDKRPGFKSNMDCAV